LIFSLFVSTAMDNFQGFFGARKSTDNFKTFVPDGQLSAIMSLGIEAVPISTNSTDQENENDFLTVT
jgi:hypothetical protein